MITLSEDTLIDNPSFFELSGIASKEDLYTILKKIGHPLPKSKLKAEMRCHAANVFEADPFRYINALSSEEQKMIAQPSDYGDAK